MSDDSLHGLLREAEGKQFHFTFADGEQMLAEVVSSSHVDENDTVVLHRVGAMADECSWQVELDDIQSVTTSDGVMLHNASSPN